MHGMLVPGHQPWLVLQGTPRTARVICKLPWVAHFRCHTHMFLFMETDLIKNCASYFVASAG